MGIFNYYTRLERKEKTNFIAIVLERTGISYPSFMRKVKEDRWTKLEREAIEQIIEEQKDERSGVL